MSLSVVQTILKLKSESKLSFEEKLKFKNNGRPKPVMVIKQTTLDKKKEVNRYFRDSMYSFADWICGCEKQNAFFCFPCLLFNNDPTWCKVGTADLKHLKIKVQKHSLSAPHMNSCCSLATLGTVDIRLQLDSAYRRNLKMYNESLSKNRYILNKIIDCILFCGAFELALRGHDETESGESDNAGIFRGLINFVAELDTIFKDHLEKSTVFKGTSKIIQNELLDSMLAVTHEEIKGEISQADFIAIQVDETTDTSNKVQVVFIFRYVLNGIVCERFWKFIQPEGTTSQHLTDVISRELEYLKINESPEKLIAQSYDGASVMSGAFGGVQAKIKKNYPSAHFIHCYAHQLNLIMQKATTQDKSVKNFFANLHSFSSFFGKSPKRTAVLDEVVRVRLPRAAPTRWNFNTKCIETVYTYRSQLLDCLEKIIDNETENSSINQAIGLKGYLQNEHFLYWLNFFHLVMPHCDILFHQLQKRDIDVITTEKCIAHFNNNIEDVRAKILNNCLEEPSTQDTRRGKVEDSKRRITLEVCDIIMSEIKHRFSSNKHIIVSQLFYADRFKDYKENFPHNIFKLIKTEYPAINQLKLKTELEVLYNREDFYNSEGAIALLQLFNNNNLNNTFSETVKMLNILCTLPMTTVESERCFSTLKRIKTFLRNTMGQERLSALAMLSIEQSFIRKIKDFREKVVDHFASQKERRIDLKYKSV